MKKIILILIAALLFPNISLAQLSVRQGGTGTSTIPAGHVVFGSDTVRTNNVSDFFWDNTNKRLGIGTSTPNNKLDIYSTSKAAIGFSGASGSTYKWTLGMDVTNGGRFSIASSTALGTIDRFVIDGSGNVGIGTTTPQWNLQAAGTRPFFALSDTSAAANSKHWLTSSMGGNLYVSTTTDLYATTTPPALSLLGATGNLGVGVQVPSAKLHVRQQTNGEALRIEQNGTGRVMTIDNNGMFFNTIVTVGDASTWGGTASLEVKTATAARVGVLSKGVAAQTAPLFRGINSSNVTMNELKANGGAYFSYSVGIGTTTPIADLQVATSTANATTSVQFGKANQNKGTCMTFYDTAGTPVYGYFPAGSVTITYTSTIPSGCKN